MLAFSRMDNAIVAEVYVGALRVEIVSTDLGYRSPLATANLGMKGLAGR